MRVRGLAPLLAVCALVSAAGANGLERRSARGPVEVFVRLAPDSPLIGDLLDLEIEARTEEGVELLMPEFGEALDRFPILDFSSREDVTPEGGTRAIQRYLLEPPTSGEHSIPPLLVEFVDRRPGAESAPEGADAHELLTERIEFEVASVLPSGATPELRPPLPPLAMLGPTIAAAVGLARSCGSRAGSGRTGALGPGWARALDAFSAAPTRSRARSSTACYRVRARARQRSTASTSSSQESCDSTSKGRFDLRSPELTTEEFFVVASESPDLSQELRSLLHEFLSRADLVKFAGHRPGSAEVEGSLGAASRVLEETRELGGGQTELAAVRAPAGV